MKEYDRRGLSLNHFLWVGQCTAITESESDEWVSSRNFRDFIGRFRLAYTAHVINLGISRK
jgi:hypothetical protein